MSRPTFLIFLLLPLLILRAPAAPDLSSPSTETIILIRHGEKPATDLGQLTPQGLNRALALPDVLVGKFGKPNFIFAPLTGAKLDRSGGAHSYIRPLMTIEPTAIRLCLPVDTRYPFEDIAGLQRELKTDPYKNAIIFIAWEHHLGEQFARSLVTSFKGDPKLVPAWSDDDFDSIYIIKIRTDDGRRTITFTLDHEGLNGLSKEYPIPAKN